VLVVHRFTVADGGGERFLARARTAVAALAGRPGYRGGWVGQAPDEPSAWVMATLWDGIGAYRRALSSYEAKLDAHPLLAEADGGPGAYEVRYADEPGTAPREHPSGRAPDADTTGPARGAQA
jgi:hypothetical protein